MAVTGKINLAPGAANTRPLTTVPLTTVVVSSTAERLVRTGLNKGLTGMPEHESWLDEDFPLGDGNADTEATVHCLYCGEEVEIAVDPGGGSVQEYIEDCAVCCRPWRVYLHYDSQGRASVQLESPDD